MKTGIEGLERPSWDETWMAVATAIAQRSPCGVRQVGCVLVGADKRVAATGYNGPPSGYPLEAGCPQESGDALCIAPHAEMNALMYSDRDARREGTAYITTAPCLKCALALANSGIRRIVCPSADARQDPLEVMWVQHVLAECAIRVVVWQK